MTAPLKTTDSDDSYMFINYLDEDPGDWSNDSYIYCFNVKCRPAAFKNKSKMAEE